MRFDLMLDCADVEAQARFWTQALGYERIDDPHDPDPVLRDPDDPERPALWLQHVPEPKVAKNRLHLDLFVHDPEAEADRLVALGATRVERVDSPTTDSWWIVLTDPEGNELCACQGPPNR
jgi:catechol 2,3-dioxygenase-like lactoylglutathione lyase family enzyme